MIPMRRIFIPIALLAALGGAATGYGLQDDPASHRPTALSSPPNANTEGHAQHFAVDLVPTAVADKRLQFSLALTNTDRRSRRIKYAIEVVSDKGETIETPFVSDVVDVASTGATFARTTDELPEGFLIIRATIATSFVQPEAVETRHLYLHVLNGEISIMEPHEWMEQSAVNEGHDL